MAISGDICVDSCPPSSFEITSLEGRRNCITNRPPPPSGGDICPADPNPFIDPSKSRFGSLQPRKSFKSLHRRQASDFPLDRFDFNSTCSADNQATLSKLFGEALATLREMNQDLNAAVNAAVDEKLPTNSNVAVAFGDLNTVQARRIQRCMKTMLDTMEDPFSRMIIKSCKFVGGSAGGALAAAAIGDRPSFHPQLMFSSGFFTCSKTIGLDEWNIPVPKTAFIHELSHSFCLTKDTDTKEAVVYYSSESDWKAFLARSAANNFKDSLQNADAYRIWAHAVIKYGIFPKFGSEPRKTPEINSGTSKDEVKNELKKM
ncbi:hypothetical protein HK102_003020 [Quaeritorhiza haematococci]|nr:hypothetical protein HK102_003020 [Quaeritorhiza haematococci]